MSQNSLISLPMPVKVITSCPLNHGVATLDHLLVELMGASDADAFDAALDLRWSLVHFEDAETIIQQFFSLRAFVEERHYLSCYRLRRWLENNLVARVSPDRHQAPASVALRLDALDLLELKTRCRQFAGQTGTPWGRVQFVFQSQTVAV